MSLLSMALIGIGRDLAGADEKLARDAAVSKTRLVPSPARTAAAPGPPVAGGGAQQSATVATFGQLVVAQIPSEALLAYTTLLALFTAAGSATSYRVGRWLVYGAAIVVCAASVMAGYFAQRDYAFIDTSPASAPPVETASPSRVARRRAAIRQPRKGRRAGRGRRPRVRTSPRR